MAIIFALAGGLIVAAVGVAYIRGIVRGEIRPHPFTWGLWSLLGAIGFAAGLAGGGGVGLAPVGVLMVENLIIFALAMRERSPEEERVHPVLIVIAVVGLVGWLLSGSPALAAVGAVTADFMAAIPTIKKTWRDPSSEPAWLWGVEAVAMALGLAALAHFTLASVLFPAYLVATNCAVAVLALRSEHSGGA